MGGEGEGEAEREEVLGREQSRVRQNSKGKSGLPYGEQKRGENSSKSYDSQALRQKWAEF